ncbi:hypothetical protein FB390_5769 [Nocardia bhagyanarayanae]|uniref:Uncharacterized protein n=1 Tax=Nocardia bhagyanarayanae TaxID=1215925 RepID=A0A543EVN6_9NOCA|nr:hypothetical protein FB390_5769 [Nocardia bhagyanarayanae]
MCHLSMANWVALGSSRRARIGMIEWDGHRCLGPGGVGVLCRRRLRGAAGGEPRWRPDAGGAVRFPPFVAERGSCVESVASVGVSDARAASLDARAAAARVSAFVAAPC